MGAPGLAGVGRALRAGGLASIAVVACLAKGEAQARADEGATASLVLMADLDDDDANGKPDGEQNVLLHEARADLVPIDPSLDGAVLRLVSGAGKVRLVAGSTPVPFGARVALGWAWQGLAPGRAEVSARLKSGREKKIAIEVRGVTMRDVVGKNVPMTKGQASIDRTPPTRAGTPEAAADTDALRAVIAVPDGADTIDVTVESYGATGVKLDALARIALAPAQCPETWPGVHCLETAPLRFVVDDVDRSHPLVIERSLRTEVGGAIVVRSAGRKQAIRVLGPRESELGAIGRYRAHIRPIVLRAAAGAMPAIGGSDAGAVAMLRAELALASATWGQCGVSFGDASKLDVAVVDPPPRHLLSLGDDLGLPASGGEVRLRVDGRAIAVTVPRGASLEQVAHQIAGALSRLGYGAIISSNARVLPGAESGLDLSVRRPNGALAHLDGQNGAPLSTDPTLNVRIGDVEPADGIEHFSDMNSMAGTLEERTLVKAFDDGDPSSIELFVVPYFTGVGRIGESFIFGDGHDSPSMRNTILLDRGGVRARRSSFTLAHELGHILLQSPGHPDDYTADTPTLLMDSDASDASAFGPRRLSASECVRVLRQSGPASRLPLLTPWPLGPLNLK